MIASRFFLSSWIKYSSGFTPPRVNKTEPICHPRLKGIGSGNYQNFDKTLVKFFPNFTRHHLITQTYISHAAAVRNYHQNVAEKFN